MSISVQISVKLFSFRYVHVENAPTMLLWLVELELIGLLANFISSRVEGGAE